MRVLSRKSGLLFACVVFAGLTANQPAQAHPHVWIEAHSDVVFDDNGKIIAINVEWEFDELYSAAATEGLDANGNGLFEPEELQPVAAENISALKEYSYFTYLTVAGKLVEFADVTEFGSSHKDGKLKLYFSAPLKQPVDPMQADISYTLHDPTFMIAIELAPTDAVSIVGKAPKACAIEIKKSAAEATDAPTAESFFENLSDSVDFAAQYAQPIAVSCSPKPAS